MYLCLSYGIFFSCFCLRRTASVFPSILQFFLIVNACSLVFLRASDLGFSCWERRGISLSNTPVLGRYFWISVSRPLCPPVVRYTHPFLLFPQLNAPELLKYCALACQWYLCSFRVFLFHAFVCMCSLLLYVCPHFVYMPSFCRYALLL